MQLHVYRLRRILGQLTLIFHFASNASQGAHDDLLHTETFWNLILDL